MMITMCGHLEFTNRFSTDPMLVHKSGNPGTADLNALSFQRISYPGTAINMVRFRMNGFYPIQYLIIDYFTLTWRTTKPGIVTAPTHFEGSAHFLYRKYMIMFIDKCVFHRDGFEKMAKAFFKMSRSIVTSANCFLSWRSSSSGSLSLPYPGKA